MAALLVLAPTTPADAAVRRTVSGWLPYWSMTPNLAHFTDNAALFRAVSPFWYRAEAATTIYAHPGAGSQTVKNAVRAKGVPLIPTLTETMPAPDMANILGYRSRREWHEDRIVRLVMDHAYDGIDIDYEQFLVTTDPNVAATNKTGFSAFVVGLCGKLKSRGKKCVITVNARVDDAMQASYRPTHSVGVFDYAVIAKHATTMRIMAYGQHYPSGTRGPVAGYAWVEAIAKYTAAKAPTYKHKVEIGVAQVGYDWGAAGVRATPYTYAQAVARRKAVGSPRIWSDKEQAPYFNYRDGKGVAHQVWYDDAQSAAIRARLALRYGFAGIAIWYAGIEDPRLWSSLRAMSS
jgi:spore germination protein YaaH